MLIYEKNLLFSYFYLSFLKHKTYATTVNSK